MAKAKKPDVQQMLLDKIAELTQKVELLSQNQQARTSPKHEKGQPRPEVYYVLLGVPTQGFRPQAIVCARVLATAADTNHITEAEAMKLIEAAKASGRLKTKQGAWHIFQYYRPDLIAGDFLLMKSE